MTEPNVATLFQVRISKYAMLRRRATALLCASSLMLQQACYTSTPVTGSSAAPVGQVTITINERGRLLVGNRLGTLVDNVVGRIVRSDSANVEVAVESAEDVRGSMARWGGEKFTIPREGIQSITSKKVNKGRTAFLVGGIVIGIVVGLLGLHGRKNSSNGLPDGEGPPPI